MSANKKNNKRSTEDEIDDSDIADDEEWDYPGS